MKHCPFCSIKNLERYTLASKAIMMFEPLNPVTPGHLLFTPLTHIEHRDIVSPQAIGQCMKDAAEHGHAIGQDFNLITSSGPTATQTVDHIHVHYVPRSKGDGLHLPWTGQKKS